MPDLLPVPAAFSAPTSGQPDLLFIAGEHSGDEHAARILADMRTRYPNVNVACLGGIELQAAGAQLLYDLTEVSVVGFVEVLKNYGYFKSLFDLTLEWIDRYRPKHICFVDYPGFNLRLADQLMQRGLSKKGGGSIGLSYYISPQVWAWKAKRRFKMARILDRLGVIFPFEVACFEDTDLAAEFVGHPFVRDDYELPLAYDPAAPVLLLPGSRVGAVGRIFPVLLKGFQKAKVSKSDLKAIVIYPSERILEVLKGILKDYPDLNGDIEFVLNTTKQMPASAVLMSSGTMSLAVALSGIPGAITYRLNAVSYFIGKILVHIPYIGMANLLLDRPLHPEYIQGAARAELLAKEILHALNDPDAAESAARSSAELFKILGKGSDLNAAEWLLRGMDM